MDFSAYGHAFASIVLFALIAMALAPMSATAKRKDGLAPGATPEQDYANRTYRVHRAQANAVETLPVFIALAFAAILCGVSPHWVNWLCSLIVVARLAMVYFHVTGRGSPDMGPRFVTYASSMACHLVLALLTLAKLF